MVSEAFVLLILLLLVDNFTAIQLSLITRFNRNSYRVSCENDFGEQILDATLLLNATIPPADCFSASVIAGVHVLNFTTSCEGTLHITRVLMEHIPGTQSCTAHHNVAINEPHF